MARWPALESRVDEGLVRGWIVRRKSVAFLRAATNNACSTAKRSWQREAVVYSGAFGLANRGAKRTYTASTPWCSGFALEAHHRRGRDDARRKGAGDVREPAVAVAARVLACYRSGNGSAIATHTSGVPDYPDLGVDRPGVSNAEILAALRRVKDTVFPPGLKYQYSNGGYVLLGQILESLSGTTLPQFLAARIFKPLGMRFHVRVDESG